MKDGRLELDDFNIIDNKSEVFFNGSEWDSNNFGNFKIIGKLLIEGSNKNFYLCEFYDGTLVRADGGHIKNGEVKNPCKPNIYGIGYMGQGQYKCSIEWKKTKEYCLWENMMKRCYDPITQSKRPFYIGTEVCTRWHNFQNFCEDLLSLENYNDWKNNNINNLWHLDKDVNSNDNRKLYSKENCKFITLAENNEEMIFRTRVKGIKIKGIRESDGYEEIFDNKREVYKKIL